MQGVNVMKKAFSILLVLSLAFMVVGCKSTPPAVSGGSPSNAPDWWNEIRPPEDVLWGDGMAKQSNPSMSMTTAESRARVSIARQLNTMVQAMFVDYNLDAGNVNNLASTTLQENVSRQITNMNVSGAVPIKRSEAPDGTYYYRLELKKSDAKNAVASLLRNEEATYAQFKTQQALQYLDAQLANNQGTLQVND
jgi:hypothetical protein